MKDGDVVYVFRPISVVVSKSEVNIFAVYFCVNVAFGTMSTMDCGKPVLVMFLKNHENLN